LNAADKLASLAKRFDAEMAQPIEPLGSRADALIRGRIRYLQILGRRVCAESGLQEPLWVNDPLATGIPSINSTEEIHHG
jgi:hypothetical protein